jgi:hypothetical protein
MKEGKLQGFSCLTLAFLFVGEGLMVLLKDFSSSIFFRLKAPYVFLLAHSNLFPFIFVFFLQATVLFFFFTLLSSFPALIRPQSPLVEVFPIIVISIHSKDALDFFVQFLFFLFL